MKTLVNNVWVIMILLITALPGCVSSDEQPTTDPIAETGYEDLNTTNFSNSEIKISLTDEYGTAFSGLKVSLWNDSPLNGGEIIFKGITDANGQLNTTYNVPNHMESIILEIGYLGLPDFLVIPVDELDEITISGYVHNFTPLDESLVPNQSLVTDNPTGDNPNGRVAIATLESLGSYNSNGKPDYLLERDQLSNQLLERINASLPEGKPVPDYHPSYLEDGTQSNLDIIATADVWMTFVTEGAGYRNALGFYTYETANPPQTPDDIDVIYIGFPNASLSGYGGELLPGDKIHLGQFQPGTSIGFALIANGFNPSNATVKTNATRYYSSLDLNAENEGFKHHVVTLWDSEEELFLIGFEDLPRSANRSDNDFNDAVFYITANPIEAINRSNVKSIDSPEDADGDGVNDTYDEFPNDARYAYRYAYPGENTFGTFAFEDQWPNFGDYDFNDLVVDYQFNQLANSSNKVSEIEMKFVIKAIGAGFNNAFGLQLDIASDRIASVSGNDMFDNLLSLNSNGTEANQSKATVIVSDDTHQTVGKNGLYNTNPDIEYIEPDTMTVSVAFGTPMNSSDIGNAPFNPFLIINKERGREVHMPGYNPTDLVDASFFGQSNDGSDPSLNIYYKSKAGLPWGMNLPISFEYPEEKVDIRSAYNFFNSWAKSSGFSFMDWYTDKSGHKNGDKLYRKRN